MIKYILKKQNFIIITICHLLLIILHINQYLYGLKALRLFYILLIFFDAFVSYSQEKTFSHYGLEEGISQGAVRTITKDIGGFIWFGTQDGLNRFDGNSFKIYKHNNKKPNTISGNYINALLDDDDKLWIATANNGLCFYNKNKDIFNKLGNQNSNCTGIAGDKRGNIYASYSNQRLSLFSKKNDSIYESKIELPLINNDIITSLYVNDKGELFIGTKNGSIFIYHNKARLLLVDKSLNSINKIIEITGNLWLGTNNGLVIYKQNNKSVENVLIDSDFEKKNKLVINDIIQIESTYYFATDNGLYIVKGLKNGGFKTVEHLKGDINTKKSITSNRVYDLLLDDKLLWIGTNKLDLLSLEEPVFKTYNTKSKIQLNNDFVFSIYKTKEYTFIGTRNGLNCIDNEGKVTYITQENTNLAFNVIRGINRDNNNNLWFATTKGISIIDLDDFDPNKPKIKTIQPKPNDPNSLSFDNTRSIFIDHKNRIWVSTFGGGICLFTGDLDSNVFSFKQFRQNDSENSISSDFTFNISQDADGNYWIATKNGLNKLSFSKDGRYKFDVFNKQNNLLNTSTILTTYQDFNNKLIWIGSHTGMYKYDIDKETFTQYSQEEGLTNDVVYSILEVDKYLWLSTNTGIFEFDKKNETFRNFNKKDGLQNSEFNLGALFKDNDTLYFGGVNGVNYFNPDDISKLYYEGNLVFTSLTVKDNEITPSEHSDILNTNIVAADKIELNYDDFPCYLSFSDLHFSKEKSSRFEYRLIPNDNSWNALKGRKEIQLLNLSAGKYKLQVQGKSNKKYWDKKPLEVEIIVTAAWYKSNWAYLIYSLLLVGLLFLFYRFQMEKKLNRRELFRLQEVAKKNIIINKTLAEKEVLFKEIHHRVKNNLQVISSILSLQERYLKNPKAIAAIRDSQHRIDAISLIHQKLYTDENITAIKIKDYIDDLAFSIIDSLETGGKKVKYSSSIENILLEVDTVTPIGLILNELIINSIKHNSTTDTLHLQINLNKKEEVLVLIVSDNGTGVPEDFDFTKTDSYGMKLIQSLSKKLKADIKFKNKNGLEVVINIHKFKEV